MRICYMKYLLLFFIVIICTCCRKSTSNNERIQYEKSLITDSTVIIDVMSNVHENYPLSRLIDSVRYVALEYSDEAMIGLIREIKVVNNLIYILDLQSEQLKCFDSKGAFIRNVCKKGRGPEEVTHLINFDVDKNYIYVFDEAKIAIHVYDHSGNYIEKRDLPFRAFNFKILPNNNYLWNLAPYSITNEENLDLVAFTDSSFSFRQKYLKYIDGLSMGVSFENRLEFNYLYLSYGNSIYEKKDSTIFMKYYLDFGDKYFNFSKDVNGFEDALENEIYFTDRAPLHNDRYLLHSYSYTQRRDGSLFIRLQDNKSMLVKSVNEDRDDVFHFHFDYTLGYDSENNEFYGLSNYLDLSSVESDPNGVVKKMKEIIPKEVQPYIIPENAEKEVNRILMFYKLKEDIDFDLAE